MEATQPTTYEPKASWLDRPLISAITLNWETILFATLLILAVLTRFYDLGVRVMSHDETSHVYFSWLLEQGRGYKHDPITHGPLQFHLIALSYFLFGDSDFTARIPAALFSIATIAFVWNYRRYLGRAGALVASFLMLISPFMLYYGRYVRNEALVAFFGVVMLWAILRYLETGLARYMFWLTAAVVLHFTAKETAFIYTAQALIFLVLYLTFRVAQANWQKPESRPRFLAALGVSVLLLVTAAGMHFAGKGGAQPNAAETALPSVPGQVLAPTSPSSSLSPALILAVLAILSLIAAAYFLLRGYTLNRLREERSFDLIILLGTLVLPMLAPFPVKLLGWDPTDYSTQGMLRTSAFLVPLAVLALLIGLWWKPRLWLANMALFYGVFIVFYTTLFTNGAGFFTGLVGALGYWLAQQGVQRGNQPWYYFFLVQVPVYEYLALLGSLLALYLGLRPHSRPFFSQRSIEVEPVTESPEGVEPQAPLPRRRIGSGLALTLIGYWIVTSFLAYTYAGEKMPWLTVHIAWPMILLAGWGIGYLIETTDWSVFRVKRGYVAAALIVVFLLSAAATLASLLGTHPPFQGKTLDQLQDTSTFITALLTALASGWGLIYVLRTWSLAQFGRMMTLGFFTLLAVLTIRTSFRAAYINYNNAKEYLVYAHSGPGNKEALAQIKDLSLRLTDGLAMEVAYDSETTYPFWWYLRNFTNQHYFGDNPTRDLRDSPVILVGDKNFGKIEPIVGEAYYRFDYIRMWWPNQDYFNLTFDRVWGAITDPSWRSAIFQIWFNRDYTEYGQLTNEVMSLPNWQPSARMRLYIRKDIAAQIWNYGVGPTTEAVVADPYEGKGVTIAPDAVIGSTGSDPGQFKRERDLVVAPDGTLYVADTENHRIQHLNPDGSVINVWGSYADVSKGSAPGGTFFEPWGIALGPDGSVYVADTWNHRIQKFTADGKFLKMWGFFGQGETPFALWGPRDVIVDPQGRILVTDTGNDRVVIYDQDGNYITQFGSKGFSPGQFDEPVGMAIDGQGNLYVADTWNQRMQSFKPDGSGSYTPLTTWDVAAWYGQSWDNKPYLAADQNGHVFATDPEGYRVLEFTSDGKILRFWGDYSTNTDGFGLAGAVAVDPSGGVWVSDTGNGRLLHFTLP